MISEDYVSLEIAKLLKEKGFDEPVTELNKLLFKEGEKPVLKITHQKAMKWLREVHNIDIFPWKICKGIYSCAIFNSNTGQDLSSNKDFPSEKYEETVEAAIKYCLENLI